MRRKSRLQLILKLLEDDQVEQSVGKEKAAGGGMPICKMSGTKPPDGTAHGSEQISPKAAGGGMPICKMSETKLPDGNASEKTDVKGSTAESLPEKPPLHHKLTGLFTLQKQIIDAE